MSVYRDLEAVIDNELDQCDRAILHGNTEKALRESREAVNKLDDTARKLRTAPVERIPTVVRRDQL